MTKPKPVKLDEKPSSALTLTNSPAVMVRQASDVAGLCREIVKKTASIIQGNSYVRVEGWEAIAAAHGCAAGARDVEQVDGGIRCVGELRRIADGVLIAQAEGFVGDDEPQWAKRPMYARRAMCQTRAISRVCRSAFAHVVVLIDEKLSTTPAEEIPSEGFSEAKHSPMRAYEEEPIKTKHDTMSDLMALSLWLKEQGIPEGFALAMLKEKKLVSAQLKLLANAPAGVINRTLASKDRLLKAWQASNEGGASDSEAAQIASPKATVTARPPRTFANGEGTRQPVQQDISPSDLLEQEGVEDWRTVAIHFGKQNGTALGKLTAKSLVWWITNWTPTQWKDQWKQPDLMLDAALCLAHEEMADTEARGRAD